MSGQASAHYIEQYENRVTHLFQAKGFLYNGMVTPHSRIEGKKAYWPRQGSGEAKDKVPGQAATPMNPNKDQVSADLVTGEAFDNVNKFDESRTNVNEKEANAKTGAMALGRWADKKIISKINASAATSGDLFYDQNAAAFTLEHALRMETRLQDSTEGMAFDPFLPLPPHFWEQLLKYKQFTAADYIGPDLPFIRKVEAKTWNGIHFLRQPKSYTDYVVSAETYWDVFMFDKASVGWANNSTLDSWWTWDNKFGQWDVRLESEGAAVVIQDTGIVRGRFDKDAVVSFN